MAACSSGGDAPTDFATRVAIQGTESSKFLLEGGNRKPRPGAPLGVYSTSHLALATSLSRTALQAIQVQMESFQSTQRQENEMYAVLQELGTTLQVDIQDTLNRSPDRAKTLDDYVVVMRRQIASAQTQVTAVEERYETMVDRRRERRKEVSDIERELNTAIREKDFVTAAARQQVLSDREAELAEIEIEERQLRDTQFVYEDLLDASDERLNAILANRAVLIAGVTVVDVPGIEDIGVFRDERGGRDANESIFD